MDLGRRSISYIFFCKVYDSSYSAMPPLSLKSTMNYPAINYNISSITITITFLFVTGFMPSPHWQRLCDLIGTTLVLKPFITFLKPNNESCGGSGWRNKEMKKGNATLIITRTFMKQLRK